MLLDLPRKNPFQEHGRINTVDRELCLPIPLFWINRMSFSQAVNAVAVTCQKH